MNVIESVRLLWSGQELHPTRAGNNDDEKGGD